MLFTVPYYADFITTPLSSMAEDIVLLGATYHAFLDCDGYSDVFFRVTNSGGVPIRSYSLRVEVETADLLRINEANAFSKHAACLPTQTTHELAPYETGNSIAHFEEYVLGQDVRARMQLCSEDNMMGLHTTLHQRSMLTSSSIRKHAAKSIDSHHLEECVFVRWM